MKEMIGKAKISKGSIIHIPKKIMEEMKLEPGNEIEFFLEKEEISIEKKD